MPITKFILDTIEKKDLKTTMIDLSNQGLFDDDLDVLITALNNNPMIQALKLYRNNLSDHVATLISEHAVQQSINVSENDLSAETLKKIADTTRINREKAKPDQLLGKEAKQVDQQSSMVFFSHKQQEKKSTFEQTSANFTSMENPNKAN